MLTLINKYSIILVLVLALFIRGYHLNSYPALNPDEAAIGYNAYSLLLTGKDEHGASWPLHFKSFGDFKPGGYFYLVLPFVKLIGLTPLAVRLPNLILSILAIYFFYKLIFLLSNSKPLSLLCSFTLTLSPWHIHFSRGGWESSAAFSFIVIGTYFFYKFINSKNSFHFLLFTFNFILSLYIYHSARIIAPLLVLSLFIIYHSSIYSLRSKIFFPILFSVLITIPVLFSFFQTGGSTRFSGVGLTADQGPIWRANELLNQHGNVKLTNRIIHNKRLLYLISWAQKYTSHFDLNFLFINGDEVPRSKVPDMGQLYLIELPFLLLGLLFFIKSTVYDLRSKIFILSWLFISPLASSLTFQAPSALRALPMVIPLSILTALGIYQFLLITKKFSSSLLVIRNLTLVIVFSYSLSYYLDSYFIHYQKRFFTSWNYGFSELIPFIESQKHNYQNIYITDKYDQPYILYLFYSKYTPQKIQSQIRLTPPDNFGFSTVRQIDNIHFEKIDYNSIPVNSLIIASDENMSNLTPIKTIDFLSLSPAFKIYIK